VKACFNPNELPPPSAAYSQVVKAGNIVFLAGMVPFDTEKNVVGEDIGEQTRKALENLDVALAAAGAKRDDVCTVTVFLSELERDFAGFNRVYSEFFSSEPPARATVSAGLLGFLVEIQATAVLTES
jgi:2-iminobutanoate/2-iminopropanoate deaminase